MDDSREDIEPYIVKYLSKLPPDILEALANKDLRAQDEQRYGDVFLPRSWNCLKTYFTNEDEFNTFLESFANQEDKRNFIWLSAFWNVMGDNYPGVYPQSIQLIVIFSIVERLYEDEPFEDFYQWLSIKKVEMEQKKSQENAGKLIQNLKEQWRIKHGASEKFRRFCRECLTNEDIKLLLECFTITNSKNKKIPTKSIDEVSGVFIKLQNIFIHRARIIDVFLSSEYEAFTSLFSTDDNKFIDTNIPFEKLLDIFKRGFINYFRKHCISI